MRRFEYTRHVIERECEQRALATYGADGWELVAVVPSQRFLHDGDTDHRWARWAMFYFKREVPS